MNPETPADRRMFVSDFGEVCNVTPTAGGTSFAITAIFNDPPQRSSELDVDQYAPTVVIGTDPHLEVSKEDRAKLALQDEIAVPSKAPITHRIHSFEAEDTDGGFFRVNLLEV